MVNQFHATNTLSAMFATSMAGNPMVVELAAKTAGVKISWGLWAAAGALPGLLSLIVVPYGFFVLTSPLRQRGGDRFTDTLVVRRRPRGDGAARGADRNDTAP